MVLCFFFQMLHSENHWNECIYVRAINNNQPYVCMQLKNLNGGSIKACFKYIVNDAVVNTKNTVIYKALNKKNSCDMGLTSLLWSIIFNTFY